MTSRFRIGLGLCLLASFFGARSVQAQPSFSVAVIRPSSHDVKFERDGQTEIQPGHLTMKDVTVQTCIKWAYDVQRSQVVGPEALEQIHYDIEAKADEPATQAQMKLMMQTLLAQRFNLQFHRDKKELKGYAMTVAKGGSKMQPSQGDGAPSRQNSANGTVAKFMTMQEFGNFIAGPLEGPVVDKTGLKGKYDFTLDFTSYLPTDERAMRPEFTTIIMAAMQGELGLKLDAQRLVVDVLVIDRVDKPSEN